MDDRLQKALDHSNYKVTIVQQKENIKARFANAVLYAKGGGLFSISPELINYVNLLIQNGEEDSVIIDSKGNPIMIVNLKEFFEDIQAQYAEAKNEFFAEYEKIRKARNVKTAVEV